MGFWDIGTGIKPLIGLEQAQLRSTFKRIVRAVLQDVIRNLGAGVLASSTFGVDLRTLDLIFYNAFQILS